MQRIKTLKIKKIWEKVIATEDRQGDPIYVNRKFWNKTKAVKQNKNEKL